MTVIRLDELPLESIVAHDGDGEIDFVRITDGLITEGGWEFVDLARVPPGASVGLHAHGDDEELYIFLRGSGIMSTNGIEERIGPRMLVINPRFATHGVRNDGDDVLEFIVVKVPANTGTNVT